MFPKLQKSTPVKPFLRWAGGKRQLLNRLLQFFPADVKNRVYREPFLGAGSLFFAVQPCKAVISDANKHLIACFEYVRDCPDLVSRYLREHTKNTSERYYYKVRQVYNESDYSAAQAARFIYLNKTCFNSIFRVNLSGEFNVPYGKQKHPPIPTREHLRKVSDVLKSADLFVAPFEEALGHVGKDDFIYLDPPYPPLNGTSCFNHYTIDKFDDKQQEKLAAMVRDLDSAGCLFMLSNANTKKIRKLYKGFRVRTLSVTRCITCKKIRHKVKELVITNYEV